MVRIATLGPAGTFSHEAVLRYDKKSELVFEKTIQDVFDAVQDGRAEYGIVPIENSTAGSVGVTYDSLLEHNLKVKAEVILPIVHNLAGLGKLRDIRVIYTHPQTHAQCVEYLRRRFPNAEVIDTSSNSRSAELVMNSKDKKKAAIVPAISAEIYGLDLLEEAVQDNGMNATRFIVLNHKDHKRTGHDKTSLVFCTYEDRPGGLHEVLGIFAKRSINLSKIESRPSGKALGEYIFYLDLDGHRQDKNVKAALAELRKTVALMKVFGSYPRKR